MKIISIEGAQVVQLVPADEVRPERSHFVPTIINIIQERYVFVSVPKSLDALQKGMTFEHGQLITSDRTIVINELKIYNDGILVTARDTDECDLMADDIIDWAINTLGYRPPETRIPRTYTSTMVVEFDDRIERAFKVIDIIGPKLSKLLKRAYSFDIDIELSRFSIAANQQKVPQYTKSEFAIERRLGERAGGVFENRFYCIAPVRTSEHKELLAEFEQVLLAD